MRVSNLGYPRLGRGRELKHGLESWFGGKVDAGEVLKVGAEVCIERWKRQRELGVDTIPVGDFSFFDHVLDMSLLLGIIPERFAAQTGWLEQSRAMARGTKDAAPLAVRKWFNTNYHYLVPEFSKKNFVEPRWEKLRFELELAATTDATYHPVIVGPWTFVRIAQLEGLTVSEAIALVLPRYGALLKEMQKRGFEYVQVDEPFLCHDMVREDLRAVRALYESMNGFGMPILIATYFGSPESWLTEIANLPCQGFHFDLLYWTTTTAWLMTRAFPRTKELSLGIVNGRNVWASPLWTYKEDLQRIVDSYGPDKISLAPTCSLLHLPLDRTLEKQWDPEFSSWVSFADQRLEELAFLKRALSGDKNVETLLKQRQAALSGRSVSARVHRPEVKQGVARIEAQQSARGGSPPPARVAKHGIAVELPPLPTSTIGSFPQTPELRKTRQEWKKGKINDEQYKKAMHEEIERVIRLQEKLGLDVLVHGEVERSDMVEYFAEHWDGVALSTQGWVQSLGTRCVKPPLIFGDVRRRSPAAVSWFTYAQGLTAKPVKAILTGPVTILNWSFVREDQARQKTAYQLALAVRDEVVDLEKAGARIIQIDEAALREGLPMMRVHWNQYLRWAVEAFNTVANAISPKVQLQVHLCYSTFSDIAEILPQLGADVLLIETARGGDELLKRLKKNRYPGAVGAGVIDVHASHMPDSKACEEKIEEWLKIFPAKQLWINPDCGLKGVPVEDAERALEAMVAATRAVRARLTR